LKIEINKSGDGVEGEVKEIGSVRHGLQELVTRLSELQSRDVRIIDMEFEILKRELELLKIRSPMTNSARCTNPVPDTQVELWDKKEEIESGPKGGAAVATEEGQRWRRRRERAEKGELLQL
jgi:hypothetical protein